MQPEHFYEAEQMHCKVLYWELGGCDNYGVLECVLSIVKLEQIKEVNTWAAYVISQWIEDKRQPVSLVRQLKRIQFAQATLQHCWMSSSRALPPSVISTTPSFWAYIRFSYGTRLWHSGNISQAPHLSTWNLDFWHIQDPSKPTALSYIFSKIYIFSCEI